MVDAPERRTVVVGAGEPQRLDRLVRALLPGVSLRLARGLIAAGEVRVEGRRARKGTLVAPGATVSLPAAATLAPNPALDLEVLYEDAALVAVAKPGGMRGHALDPRDRVTVANFLVARHPETAALAGGLVHRLDTGTSGVLLAARTAQAFTALRAAFRAHRIEKEYLALVEGTAPAGARVRTPLAHDPRDRRRMMPAGPGARQWQAETVVRRLAAAGGVSLVALAMRTGVTHQLRVHLASLGHPVLGDRLYGRPHPALPPHRHALHAARLVLPPLDGAPTRRIESALPPDLAALAPPLD